MLLLLQAVSCNRCYQVLGLAQEIYEYNKTSEYIEEALTAICESNRKCISYIQYNKKTFSVYFKHKYPVQPLCDLLGVCGMPEVTATNPCDSCKQNLAFLDRMLAYSSKSGYQHMIKDYVCRSLPNQLHTRICAELAGHRHLDDLRKLKGEFACYLMRHCPGHYKMRDGCKFCKFIAQFSDTPIAIENACQLVEVADRDYCRKFIKDYGREIEKHGAKACQASVCTEL